ncbi:MAG: hypothetical protein J5633_07475 [Oscillospiraceae bacterium]|nr:hypothetical protein [Oscillospiraceae bacterium]
MEDRSSPMLALLGRKDWGDEQPRVDLLLASPYGEALLKALKTLKRNVLYQSHVHGLGHIERTLVHGAMCAQAEKLDAADTSLLMDMCSYHDTGRESDWLDGAHGLRSSLKLAELTGRRGEDLRIMMAGVEAHSIGDKYMEDVIRKHGPADPERALRMARLLKDSDGLDRVRIRDLNPKYLRFESSRKRARFAQLLFDRYRAIQGEWGVQQEQDGFDLGVIQALKQFVSDCFARQTPCGETALLALDKLIREDHAKDLLPQLKTGSPVCGLYDAALLYLRAVYPEDDPAELEAEFSARFKAQYGSLLCADVKPDEGCGGFAVDGILFALQFYLDKLKDRVKDD